MPIESATWIDGLNASNPVGSTDKVQTLDDHVRLIKSAVKASFPGVAGAVTATHTELNHVDGVTSALQTQLDGKSSTSHVHSGADITSGTLPDGRFPSTLPALSGVNLTALNATNLASGTVADARLSANVPLINAENVLTGRTLRISNATDPRLVLSDTNAGTDAKNFALRSDTAELKVTGLDDSLGAVANLLVAHFTGAAFDTLAIGAVTMTFTGNVASPHTSASEVGKIGAPSRDINDTTNTAASDMGRTIRMTGGASKTFTLDADPPEDAVVILDNASGNAWTIAASGTLVWAATGGSGSRTLADGGMAVALHQGSGVWKISGGGLS